MPAMLTRSLDLVRDASVCGGEAPVAGESLDQL
jgi:hypothetical protein